MKELIAEAKNNPGKLTNASSSNGSPGHVGGELFKFMAGIEIVHVPYRGGAAATNDLIAGRVAVHVREPQLDLAARQVRRGARAGGERRPALAGVPRSADGGGGRRAGLQRADLERRDRAGRHAAADRREAQRRGQPRDQDAGLHGRASARSATSRPAARRRSSPRRSPRIRRSGRTWWSAREW